jgi:hypothetical protein
MAGLDAAAPYVVGKVKKSTFFVDEYTYYPQIFMTSGMWN